MDAARGRQVAEVLAAFCARPPIPVPPSDPAAVEVTVLELFHRVATSVPAYQDFLHEHALRAGMHLQTLLLALGTRGRVRTAKPPLQVPSCFVRSCKHHGWAGCRASVHCVLQGLGGCNGTMGRS